MARDMARGTHRMHWATTSVLRQRQRQQQQLGAADVKAHVAEEHVMLDTARVLTEQIQRHIATPTCSMLDG